MQPVLSHTNGNYKSSVTALWEPFLGDGIIRVSGMCVVHMCLQALRVYRSVTIICL